MLTLADPESDFYPLHERVRRVGLGVWREPGAGGRLLLPLARRRALKAAIRAGGPEIHGLV